MKEEIFGPVYTFFKFDDEDTAIKIANNTEYGLGSVIVSQDESHAQKLAERIDSGMTFINQIVLSTFSLPSGGIKNSGFGREMGQDGFNEFANCKVVWVDKKSKL
mmetsp:Transcript_15355/g.33614  ORF Transcript_15355/g.33614 Transcript_15355/m.33614 type:complete len:105 (-) Transcript_15355:56-370(-)